MQSPDGEIAGGVLAELYWGWLYIDLMWIEEELRGKDYGHRLLTQVEDEARQRGAKQAYLDTFSFQAPEFSNNLATRLWLNCKIFQQGISVIF